MKKRNLTYSAFMRILNRMITYDKEITFTNYKFGSFKLWMPCHVIREAAVCSLKYKFTEDYPWYEMVNSLRKLNVWPPELDERLLDESWDEVFESMENGADLCEHPDQMARRTMFTLYQFCPDLLKPSGRRRTLATRLLDDDLTYLPAPPAVKGRIGLDITWTDTFLFCFGLAYMFATDSWPYINSGCNMSLKDEDLFTLQYFPPWVQESSSSSEEEPDHNL